ncbi:Crp/Fnr family transcriptional regulator [Listeria booriae]|uniref:Crp/Fnr family transcriptional regulator n=1 Tax=Listeria booriae TaxID=1552123 RepID=UPI00162AB171|nr:Crp/Fnr family transcriptional regulator [Listeria booriae]MBC1292912.1 Crp/Fnr family transcriptional regulator [Listeria booriae]MBC1333749.1 Crp/Fnr family transcriptional regulator [Listeria booriae]MBC1945772.1 Crp/Fnr family transcriptional regulator [Listeria booriae]MBC6129483.1 Crp/Fnr family transcriptional regulator [Listeria booriae]MBC6164453.1 Crp/Fnr family transcriptional regulator [Listeria booriae]
MDFLEVHSLLLREPNLLLPLLDLSNINKNNSNFCQVKVLKNHQNLALTDSGKLIHVIKGKLLQQISNSKQIVNAIWVENDFIFHNVFQPNPYEYIAFGHVELAIYDAKAVLQELSGQPFFPDLLIDTLKRQEYQSYRYARMLTKSVQERVLEITRLLSKKDEEGYHIPKMMNYLLLSKFCQISPHTAKKAIQGLEQANKIIYKNGKPILIHDSEDLGL